MQLRYVQLEWQEKKRKKKDKLDLIFKVNMDKNFQQLTTDTGSSEN